MITLSEAQRESRLAEYNEVGQNFRALTDIRFKLLGILPIATAVGALSSSGSQGEIGVPLSLFGLAVTLALIVYNERNNQLYDGLVARAAHLERLLGIPDGYFCHRPGIWLKIRPMPRIFRNKFVVPIDHRWSIGVIYRASIIAWLFMLFSRVFHWLGPELLSRAAFRFSLSEPLPTVLALIAAAIVGELSFALFKAQKREREKKMHEQAAEAVHQLIGLNFSPPQRTDLQAWYASFSNAAALRGAEAKENAEFNEEFGEVLLRARFYLSKDLMQSTSNIYYPVPSPEWSSVFDETTAAYVIGLLADFPPASLIDVHSGRMGLDDRSKKPNKEKLSAWIEEISCGRVHTCTRSCAKKACEL